MSQNKTLLYIIETSDHYIYIAKELLKGGNGVLLKECTWSYRGILDDSTGQERRFDGGTYKTLAEVLFDFYVVSEQEGKIVDKETLDSGRIAKTYWISGEYDRKIGLIPRNYGAITLGVVQFSDGKPVVLPFIPPNTKD